MPITAPDLSASSTVAQTPFDTLKNFQTAIGTQNARKVQGLASLRNQAELAALQLLGGQQLDAAANQALNPAGLGGGGGGTGGVLGQLAANNTPLTG